MHGLPSFMHGGRLQEIFFCLWLTVGPFEEAEEEEEEVE